jgi:Family of unknown function (DUF1028)/Invasin, domain 3
MASRCAALVLAVLFLLAPPAGATWSIVLVDTATGEVAVAGATCLEGLDLLKLLPVVVVGRGGGCAQSQVDTTAANRKEIFDNLILGTPPPEIIEILIDGDLFWKSRQYGIADMSPEGAGYTGAAAGQYKEHIFGSSGTVTYAIQGNVLTGAPVIAAAQLAVTSTSGSLADKLMAGMEAARLMGGDGRCSCAPGDPTGCGSPPPSFVKSAHIGFVVVARIGDVDGICNAVKGCASGEYWLKLNAKGLMDPDPDPVFVLQQEFEAFTATLHGHPDGVRSVAGFDHDELLADGQSTRTLTVALYDYFGAPLLAGGATLTVTHAPDSAGLSAIGAVTDNGDGTYSLEVTAGASTGTDLFAVRVDDGFKPATLYPYPALRLREALEADAGALSAAAGGVVNLDLLGPSDADGRRFAVALSAAGSQPGQVLSGGLLVPLNFDRLFQLSPQLATVGLLSGTPGELDGAAHGEAALTPPAGALASLVGVELACAWFTLRPADFASQAVSVAIEP